MDNKLHTVLNILKFSLFRRTEAVEGGIDEEIFDELCIQAVAALPAFILKDVSMPQELRDKWDTVILQQVSSYANHRYAQNHLPIKVPYAIPKGTTAAQYYPHPEYRSVGDIDIITRREDFEIAYLDLIANGYKVTNELEREITFVKKGIILELHRYFASFNDPITCEYLDDLIIDNINPSHVLPDSINGLVFLEHISQHMEHGLGLRQIIDWMMFVDKCLPDEKWDEFKIHSDEIGLTTLAVITTKMCELYLGLPERQWCADADKGICEKMMEYILSSGNFGNKWTSEEAVSKTVFTYTRGFIPTVKWLQERGLANWEAAKKYKIFRPFAWIYQGVRYLTRGLRREGAIKKIKYEYDAAQERIELFEALGVKQKAKGLVTYRNGQYVKK